MAPGTRNLRTASSSKYPVVVDQWAVIVGISEYKYEKWNLKYAHRDAEELYKLIQKPSGGGYKTDHIKKLVNKEATTANITRALRTFLKEPKEEDIVLIYFSCHGAPDPGRTNNLYLLTHDTDHTDISGTALPMREIDLMFKNGTLRAERVVILADTCHSGGIGVGLGGKSPGINRGVINKYFQEVSESNEGIAMLTSAHANEVSYEDKKWGGGHGVFTHFLLRGLRGEADGCGEDPKDGKVTVGELFDYVCHNVKKEKKNQQPLIGSNTFDPDLTMAITGGIDAQEHYKIGWHVYQLGWLVDDEERFVSAGRYFDTAVKLARKGSESFSEAEFRLGQSLAAAGDYKKAARVLQKLIKREAGKAPPEALLYLGIANAGQEDYQAAGKNFAEFAKRWPGHEYTSWVDKYANSIKQSKKYALLIGVNQYASADIYPLRGCLNDVELIKEALLTKIGFEEGDIVTLVDKAATYQSILDELENLAKISNPSDMVIVHFSGHSQTDKDDYLVVHDTRIETDTMQNAIRVRELHDSMNAIPAFSKTLVLDTDPNSQFIDLVKEKGNYALLLGTSPGEMSYEHSFKLKNKPVLAGVLSGTLKQTLAAENVDKMTYGEMHESITGKIKELNIAQKPVFVGDKGRLIFGKEDVYFNLFDIARRRNYAALSSQILDREYARLCREFPDAFARAYYSFGCAFLSKDKHSKAIEALKRVLEQKDGKYLDANFALARAQIGKGIYNEALKTLQKHKALVQGTAVFSHEQDIIKLVERLKQRRKYALLVGINDYTNHEVPDVMGALNDVQALKEVLLNKLDFKEENITLLVNSEATRDAILEAFKKLVEKAREEPGLFYFAGNGSETSEGEPAIVSVDGRQEGVYDIGLQELAALVPEEDSNLVTIIDSGWTGSENIYTRKVKADKRVRPESRDISFRRDLSKFKLKIGSVSIYSGYLRSISSKGFEIESELQSPGNGDKKFYGEFTYALVRVLENLTVNTLTYTQWINSLKDQFNHYPVVFSDNPDELIFDYRTLKTGVAKIINRIEQQPVNEAIKDLLLLIEQHDRRSEVCPEEYLNLGIAYAAIQDYDQSIAAFERALAQDAQDRYPEIYYHFGRVLYESSRELGKAVDLLQKAAGKQPGNARIYYYLGQAIRGFVEREPLAKARQAFRTYLAKGAPLGHEDEVEKYLNPNGTGGPPAGGPPK